MAPAPPHPPHAAQTELLGIPVEVPVPEFRVPVLEPFQAQAQWTTTYVDDELRVGRGETAEIFVLRCPRPPPARPRTILSALTA